MWSHCFLLTILCCSSSEISNQYNWWFYASRVVYYTFTFIESSFLSIFFRRLFVQIEISASLQIFINFWNCFILCSFTLSICDSLDSSIIVGCTKSAFLTQFHPTHKGTLKIGNFSFYDIFFSPGACLNINAGWGRRQFWIIGYVLDEVALVTVD